MHRTCCTSSASTQGSRHRPWQSGRSWQTRFRMTPTPAEIVETYAHPEVPPSAPECHASAMTHIGVAVIVGQRTFADALASRIAAEPGLSVVAVAESVAAASRLLEGRHADVVLLDSELPHGLDFAAELARTRATKPQPTRVIMLGPIPEAAHVVEALRAAVAGWVPKEESI